MCYSCLGINNCCLVDFFKKTVKDLSTYDNCHQYSQGIQYIIVNGGVVVKGGKQAYWSKKHKVLHGQEINISINLNRFFHFIGSIINI